MSIATAKLPVERRDASNSSNEPRPHEINPKERKTRVQPTVRRKAPGNQKPKRPKAGPTRRVAQKVREPHQVARQLESTDEPLDGGLQLTVAHAFILFGYLVGIALFLIFGLDLLMGVPFDRGSVSYGGANVVGGLTLIYLSYNCQRDLK